MDTRAHRISFFFFFFGGGVGVANIAFYDATNGHLTYCTYGLKGRRLTSGERRVLW